MLASSRIQSLSVSILCVWLFIFAQNLIAQDSESALGSTLPEESQEYRETSMAAGRYEQILRSRPQLGTAFDKFYEFQVRRGTLDQFSDQLKSEIEQRSDAKLLLLLGLIQFQRGHQSEALATLEQAERQLPADPFSAFYFARALKDARRFDEALAVWQRTLDRKPSQALVLEILKETRLTARRTTNVAGLKNIWASIEQLYPTNLQVLKLLAESMVDQQLPDAAMQIYEKLIQQTKEPAAKLELQMQLAIVKAELGDYSAAISDLRHLLNQVNPESWLHDSLLSKIESLFSAANDPGGLIDFYTTRVAEKPNNLALVLRFAKHLAASDRKNDAKHWITNACKLAPTQPEPWEALAMLHANSGEFSDAAQAMQKLVELEPANADYIVKWGEYISLNSNVDLEARHTQAGNVWQRLLKGHEEDPATLIRVAELLHKVSMTDAALRLYRQAVSFAPAERRSEYIEFLAEYLIRLNRRDEALVELQRIDSGFNGDSGVLFRLSELLQGYGFQAEALETLQRACEGEPTSAQLLKLAEQLGEAKRYEEANVRLELAATLSSDLNELSVIWDALVRNHTYVGGLAERIDQLRTKLVDASQLHSDSQSQSTGEQWQRLALMQEAQRDFTAAAASAATSTELTPRSIPAWLLAVRMESRASYPLRQIHSLRQLCELDPKNQNYYLQTLARTQLELHQTENALATAEQCLQLASVTPSDYQQYAKLCLEAKLPERAIETMRNCVQRFPQDRQSSMALATELIKSSKFDEATERLWRTLELSRTEIEIREVLTALRTYFSSDSDSRDSSLPYKESLIGRLEAFGGEHGRDQEVALWACWLAEDLRTHADALRLVDRALTSNYANLALLQAALQVAESSDNRSAKKTICNA